MSTLAEMKGRETRIKVFSTVFTRSGDTGRETGEAREVLEKEVNNFLRPFKSNEKMVTSVTQSSAPLICGDDGSRGEVRLVIVVTYTQPIP